MAAFTSTAMPSRWLKQLASSEEVLMTAILGFSMSASEMPNALHCARLTAQREVPYSKLLLNGRVMKGSNNWGGFAGNRRGWGVPWTPGA